MPAMPITSRSFVQYTTTLLLIGFLALLCIVGLTFWLGERAQVHFHKTMDARDRRVAAVELRNAVQSAESSQRGFMVTSNEIYLAPFNAAKAFSRRQLDALGAMFARDGQENAVFERLKTVLAQKFAEMDETIALKRDRRDDDALAAFRSNRGKALMDEANIFFSGMIRAADEQLTQSVSEQQDNATWLRRLSSIGGIVIVIVIGGAAFTVIRYTQELREAQEEVRFLNAGLEQRVKDRTADLARANEEVQRFAYIVTHDLRAPLINIMGFTKMFEESTVPLKELIDKLEGGNAPSESVLRHSSIAVNEDLREAIGFIRSSTKKMDSLINAVLKLSREGQRTLRAERIALKAMITASADAIQHQLSQAGGSIQIADDLPTIVSDKLSLEQIFGNLLDNAVKYRAKQRPLRIEVRCVALIGENVGIEISDNGRGIAEQDRERVFELFRRAGAQDQQGEGIGLPFVVTLIRNLGGKISMTSELDKGTSFLVVLPRTFQSETTISI